METEILKLMPPILKHGEYFVVRGVVYENLKNLKNGVSLIKIRGIVTPNGNTKFKAAKGVITQEILLTKTTESGKMSEDKL